MRLAVPTVGTTLFQVLFNVADTFWVGRILGPDALAAVATAGYSIWILVAVGELLSIGLTAVAARRHGERRSGLRMALIPTALMSLVYVWTPETLAGLFPSDTVVIAQASGYLAAVGAVQMALAFEVTLEAACGGAGYTFWPMFWIVGLSALRIPLAYWASARYGLAGIWAILAITMVARGVALGMLWRWGSWERGKA